MPVKRFLHDPAVANMDNPDGLVLNMGEWFTIGAADEALEESNVSTQELLEAYELCAAPAMTSDSYWTNALWTFADWYILVTTYWEEVPGVTLKDAGIDASEITIPCTSIMAFRRTIGVPPPDFLAEILDGATGSVQ